MSKLAEKVVIITGVSSGIGKATALLLAQEGATVIGADIDSDKAIEVIKEIELHGGKGVFIETDVSNSNNIDKLVQRALSFGQIDILVNNAGIEVVKKLSDTSEMEWNRTIDVNLKSVYLTCKAVLPTMIKQRRGNIINNSSVSALVGSFSAVYSASKGGIVSLSKSLAVEVGSYNIRVNCVLPGAIETPMLDRVNEKLGDPDRIRQARIKMYPLGRFGNVEEIAKTILFLASDDSSFITGTSIVVDGGFISK